MTDRLTIDDILDILETEKSWSEENMETVTELDRQYKVGFLKGIKQAILLIKEAKEVFED